MFARIRQGWELTKKAWGVVREHPRLAKLPFIGGLLALIAAVVIAGPGLFLAASDTQSTQIVGYVLIAIGSYVASCIVIFYNVILAGAANEALMGREPDVPAARQVAMNRLPAIAGWALIGVIVSAIIRGLRDRGGIFGQIVGGLAAAAWGIVTFLVVPVLALEQVGPVAAMKRSVNLVKGRWGQQVTGNFVIGGAAMIVTFLGAILAVGGVALLASGAVGSSILGVVLIAIGLAIAIGAGVIASATRGVFGVALYHFTAEDIAVGPFTNEELAAVGR